MEKVQPGKPKFMNVITGAQIRAARALVRWTAEELANTANVGLSTIRRAEADDGPPTITAANLKLVRLAFESAGIEFIPENGGGAGVRFEKPAK
jgi:transcriptional regulator with XRE-family HTH domain